MPAPVSIQQPRKTTFGGNSFEGGGGGHSWGLGHSLGASASLARSPYYSALSNSLRADPAFPNSSSGSFNSFSPSSPSVLLNLERSFFRGFHCCNNDQQDLHGLLEHFEKAHVRNSRSTLIDFGTSPDAQPGFHWPDQHAQAAAAAAVAASGDPAAQARFTAMLNAARKHAASRTTAASAAPPIATFGDSASDPGKDSAGMAEAARSMLDDDDDELPGMDLDDEQTGASDGTLSGPPSPEPNYKLQTQAIVPQQANSFAQSSDAKTISLYEMKRRAMVNMYASTSAASTGGDSRKRGIDALSSTPAQAPSPLRAMATASALSTPGSSVPPTPATMSADGDLDLDGDGELPLGMEMDMDMNGVESHQAFWGAMNSIAPPSDAGVMPSLLHGDGQSVDPNALTAPLFPNASHAPVLGGNVVDLTNSINATAPRITPSTTASTLTTTASVPGIMAPAGVTSSSSSSSAGPSATPGPSAPKPFKCPIPGCDKSYKQQNGLKYHRLHGHCNNNNQHPDSPRLPQNAARGREIAEIAWRNAGLANVTAPTTSPTQSTSGSVGGVVVESDGTRVVKRRRKVVKQDGTIVWETYDVTVQVTPPTTPGGSISPAPASGTITPAGSGKVPGTPSSAEPGSLAATVGVGAAQAAAHGLPPQMVMMEDESKPFLCHLAGCGKRYKNMNGLRYHYQHSGFHGQQGLQLLSDGKHPPPQYPPGHKRHGQPMPLSNVNSREGSREGSRAGSPFIGQQLNHSGGSQSQLASPTQPQQMSFPSLPLALGSSVMC